MSSRNLVRWSGMAVIGAGIVTALHDTLDFMLPATSATSATTSAWLIDAGMNWFGHLLLVLAVVGLYSRQADRAGAFGLVAFLVVFVGAALEFGTVWGVFYITPWLARACPACLDSPGTQFAAVFPGLVGYVIPFILLGVGWILFVLASLRAKVLPRWALVLSVAGLPLTFLGVPFASTVVRGILFGAGLAWLGYFLWVGLGEGQVQKAGEG